MSVQIKQPELDGVYAIHPWLRVGDHDLAAEKLTHLRTRQQPLLHEHFLSGVRGQVTELVVSSVRKQEVYFPQGVEYLETVGDDCRIVVLFIEQRSPIKQIVERFKELRTTVNRIDIGTALP